MSKQTGSIDLNALDIAQSTEQYFWFNSVDSGAGEGAGAHITETPQDTFISDPSNGGGNVLIDSDSVDIRDGVTVLATFGANGAQIGQNATDETRTEIESNGMTITHNDSGTDYEVAHLGYGQGKDGSGQNAYAPFFTMGTPWNTLTDIGNYSVAMGNTVEASAFCSLAVGHFVKARGKESVALGDGCSATNYTSVALGNGSVASGDYAQAQNNHTRAAYDSQTAIGSYNDNKSTNLFEVGNGQSVGSESNAFEVEKTGNVNASGCYMSGGAKIGSNITIKGTGSGTLTNSVQAFALTGSQVINGNAFAYNNTSPNTGCIKCLYAGMVMISAKVRFNASFTANDYFAARAINTTQNVATEYSRMRTPTQVFNGDVIIPPMYMNVNANDIIKLQAYNITASRGTLDLANTTLSVQYIAPTL